MPRSYLERVLLVAGAQNTGKSTQLRSMFSDPRFGTARQVPTKRRVPETLALSDGRRLYLRLTSPHEVGESLTEFIDKIVAKTAAGRWCVASAVQVDAARRMPDLPEVVSKIIQRLSPERVRVAVLSPDRHAKTLASSAKLFDALWRIPGCEPHMIDARRRSANGLLLADTFDFA